MKSKVKFDFNTDGTWPLSFCNFLWKLGICPFWVKHLYQLPKNFSISRSDPQGPYLFEENTLNRSKIKFEYGRIDKSLKIQYFGSEEACDKSFN